MFALIIEFLYFNLLLIQYHCTNNLLFDIILKYLYTIYITEKGDDVAMKALMKLTPCDV